MIRERLEGRNMSSVTTGYPSNYLKYEDLINKPEVCKRRGVTLSRGLGGTFTTRDCGHGSDSRHAFRLALDL